MHSLSGFVERWGKWEEGGSALMWMFCIRWNQLFWRWTWVTVQTFNLNLSSISSLCCHPMRRAAEDVFIYIPSVTFYLPTCKVKLSLCMPWMHMGGVEKELHQFLSSTLEWGEWLPSRCGRFTPGGATPSIHWIGVCVGPRTWTLE